VKEIARELGVTDQTLYNRKSKYGGREVADAKRLRALEDENRRLRGQWDQGSRKGSQIQMKHSFLFRIIRDSCSRCLRPGAGSEADFGSRLHRGGTVWHKLLKREFKDLAAGGAS